MRALGQGRPLAALWNWLKWADVTDVKKCGYQGSLHKKYWPTYPARRQTRLSEVNVNVPETSAFRTSERNVVPLLRDDPVSGEPYAIP